MSTITINNFTAGGTELQTDDMLPFWQAATGSTRQVALSDSGLFMLGEDNTVTGDTTFSGDVTLAGGATLLGTSVALTSGAGVGAGTLTNAPSAGNPTKWISINDAGTTRKIPAW